MTSSMLFFIESSFFLSEIDQFREGLQLRPCISRLVLLLVLQLHIAQEQNILFLEY